MTILAPPPETPFYDPFDDETVSLTLWDLHEETIAPDSNITASEYAEAVNWDIDAQDGNGALNGYMISKRDIRNLGSTSLTLTVNGYAYSTSSGSMSALIRLTDGAGNTQNLVLLSAPSAAAVGDFVSIQASFDLTISGDGNTINVKVHSTSKATGSATVTVISDDTDVDVTSWAAVYLENNNSANSPFAGQNGKGALIMGRLLVLE